MEVANKMAKVSEIVVFIILFSEFRIVDLPNNPLCFSMEVSLLSNISLSDGFNNFKNNSGALPINHRKTWSGEIKEKL